MIQVLLLKSPKFIIRKDGRRDSLDLKDFLSCIIDVSNKVDGPEIIRQCFSMLDKNETGLIKTDEFRHLMKSIGDPLSNEEVKFC